MLVIRKDSLVAHLIVDVGIGIVLVTHIAHITLVVTLVTHVVLTLVDHAIWGKASLPTLPCRPHPRRPYHLGQGEFADPAMSDELVEAGGQLAFLEEKPC